MPAFGNATAFFHACEGLQGWEGCHQYVADNAIFSAQSEPIADITLLKDYCEWMAGLGSGPLAGCSYSIHSSAWDAGNRTALFFATFTGTHGGEALSLFSFLLLFHLQHFLLLLKVILPSSSLAPFPSPLFTHPRSSSSSSSSSIEKGGEEKCWLKHLYFIQPKR